MLGSKSDFSSLITNPARIRSCLIIFAAWLVAYFVAPTQIPSLTYSTTFNPLLFHLFTSGLSNLVNTNGAVASPNGRTLNM